MNGREVDNFSKDFGFGIDCSRWFKSVCMTAGPSSPPTFLGSANAQGDSLPPRTIHWSTPSLAGDCCTIEGNPNLLHSAHLHQAPELSSPMTSMAYFRADPTPFLPRGLHHLEVGPRKPMERVVLMKPRAKNQDLAIITVNPMPAHQVIFQAICNAVTQFLTEENVVFTYIQPTHLGQAYVRFRSAFDRDKLIGHGAYIFGDVSITFVEHNKGRNWRAINFNRECWLLLMGYPPDYREDEFAANTISTFGRVMYWVDDGRHLSRLLVRARVIDFESIPAVPCYDRR